MNIHNGLYYIKFTDDIISLMIYFCFFVHYFNFFIRIQGSVPGFRQRQIASVVQEAFDMFTPYVPMTFTPVSKRDPADIQIMFQSHEDDPDMDGRGKTVGWAYPPLADSRDTGKIYIDSEEDYTIEGPEGMFITKIIIIR